MGATSRGAIQRAPAVVAGVLICLGSMLPSALSAQGVTEITLRAGAGIDGGGKTFYGGQIELTDRGGSNAVQVAISGFGRAYLVEDYQEAERIRLHDVHEETRVWGVGLMANYLFRHGIEGGGPYFMAGLGVGPLWVDWRLETTNSRTGTPLPAGGSFLAERGVTVGTMLNLGIGQRLHRHIDIRAEMLTVIVPTTSQRENVKVIPAFTLTTGVGL